MPQYSSFNDSELVAMLKMADEGAFAEIYQRHWKAMYQTASSILQDEHIAQDIVQEVFISLWNRRESAEVQYLKAYLQQATRFSVLKAIRTQKNDEQFYVRLRDITTELIIEEPLLFKEQQSLLNQLIESLPVDCKAVFRLSREEQLTYKQIAAQLNISEKTVEKRMTISLKFLRKNLDVSLCVNVLVVFGFFN